MLNRLSYYIDELRSDGKIDYDVYLNLREMSDQLGDENETLRKELEKAIELPVKIGDTVYFIPTYNGNPIYGVQKGIVQMVGITRQGCHVKIRDRADFNKTYMFGKSAFLSKEPAEARIAELKGGKHEN